MPARPRARRGVTTSGMVVFQSDQRTYSLVAGDRVHDCFFGDLGTGELTDFDTVTQDDDALRVAHDLLELRTDEQDGHTLVAQGLNQFQNLRFRAHINPPGRLVAE